MIFILFVLFINARIYLPFPYNTTPNPKDIFHRYLCRGWACNEPYPLHQRTEFEDMLDMYQNETFRGSIEIKLQQLIKRDFHPAYCTLGFLEMTGLAGIQQNLTRSFDHLNAGANLNLWSCHEALSYHPWTKSPIHHIQKAVERGSVLSMLRLAIETENETESLYLLKYLATVQSTNWWKKRRSGLVYSDAISAILHLNDRNVTEAWHVIDELSLQGHLPATLWAAEGLETGEIGRKNISEARERLLKLVTIGPWKMELMPMLQSTENFDRLLLLKIAAIQGNDLAKLILSYPKLFE